MSKYLLIFNRFAGAGRARKFEDQILSYFDEHKLYYTVEYTKSSNDATRIAVTYARSDYDYYVICGGDGTINEVLNGLNSCSKTIAVIPLGTANVFAKEYRIPSKITDAIGSVLNGTATPLSIGCCNGTKFLLMTSAGLDSQVVHRMTQTLKKFGRLAYFLTAVKTAASYKYPLIHVWTNGEEYKGSFVLVSQCVNYGGFLQITPEASMEKGAFQICILKRKGFLPLLKMIMCVLAKVNHRNRDCVYLSTNKLRMGGHNIVSQSDGEPSDRLPLEISVWDETLMFMVPRHSPEPD